MFSPEQRRIAIETFIRFDHGYADTVAELGPAKAQSLVILKTFLVLYFINPLPS